MRYYLFLLGVFILSSCATRPLPENVVTYDTADIVHKIFCETKSALMELDPLKRFQATVIFEFNFTISENNNATAGAGFTIPVTNGAVSLNFSAGDKRLRKSDRQIRMATTFKAIRSKECVDVNYESYMRYPITGRIGMLELMETYFRLSPYKQKVDTYKDTLTYQTAINGGINPSIRLIPAAGRLVTANLNLSADRTDIHKVIVQLIREKTPREALLQKINSNISSIKRVEIVPTGMFAYLNDVKRICSQTGRKAECELCLKGEPGCSAELPGSAEFITNYQPDKSAPIIKRPVIRRPVISDLDSLDEALKKYERDTIIDSGRAVRDSLRERP